MFQKAVFPGKYIQGENSLEQLPKWINLLGRNGMILASNTARTKILPKYSEVLSRYSIGVEPFNGECCGTELERLATIISQKKIGVLVGMGGGNAREHRAPSEREQGGDAERGAPRPSPSLRARSRFVL